MRMERRGAKLKFHCTGLLKGRCLQVRATLSMLKCEAISHMCDRSDPNIFFTVEPESMDVGTPPMEPDSDDLYTDLTVNSVVEVTLGAGNSYGIIRWIGTLTGRQEVMAGLELVIFTHMLLGRLKSILNM